jgi:hypothetical protein
MPNSITTVTADKYDDIASGEPVRVTLAYDADDDGLFLMAAARTPGFEVAVQPAPALAGIVPVMSGPGQTTDVWLIVKRAATTAQNCMVELRVGDSNPYHLPLGVKP